MSHLFGDAYASVTDPFLRRACELAERGRGTVAPNPLVGCVIVRDGEVVGEGWHAHAGGPHAEIVALEAARSAARGATVYVTLEPCSHQGRTPPCTGALINAEVSSVVVGMRDPNTAVNGRGAEALTSAGVDVSFARDAAPFEELNAGWLTFLEKGRPRVRVKLALTLDGHAAIRPGVRARISGVKAASLTERLRGESDAVAVGRGTLVSDDPALTVRSQAGETARRQPVRTVICLSAMPPADARIFTDHLGPSAIVAPRGLAGLERLRGGPTTVLEYDADDGLAGALGALARADVVDLLVEAGPRLFTGLWRDDLIDELVVYHAGGCAGPVAPPLLMDESLDGEALRNRMSAVEAGVVGLDAVTVWRAPAS